MDLSNILQAREEKDLKDYLGIFLDYRSSRKISQERIIVIDWQWLMFVNVATSVGSLRSIFGLRDLVAYWPPPSIMWQTAIFFASLNCCMIVTWSVFLMKKRPAVIANLFAMLQRKSYGIIYQRCQLACDAVGIFNILIISFLNLKIIIGLGVAFEMLDIGVAINLSCCAFFCSQLVLKTILFICHTCHHISACLKELAKNSTVLISEKMLNLESVYKHVKQFNAL